MSREDQVRHICCFQEWMNLEGLDLSELLQAQGQAQVQVQAQTLDSTRYHNFLSQLTDKNIQHFQDYMNKRQTLARDDVSPFFAPSWCTSLENSLLWIAGYRPSMYIRLVYALCAWEIESTLTQFLQGIRTDKLSEITASQLTMVNELQGKTVWDEDKLTSRLASLQEDVADHPIAMIAKEASRIGESNGDAEKALDTHERAMVSILEDADQLRMSTLKELIIIMTPVQAVEFLVASKKLHFCLHEWGKNRDHKHGRS